MRLPSPANAVRRLLVVLPAVWPVVSCGDNGTTSPPPPAVATRLAFIAQPMNSTGGATLATVTVEARDANGNPVTSYAGNVTVAIGANAGKGTLWGTTVEPAANGVATFTTLSIDSVGTGYTLTASASGLASATSSAFDVAVGAPVKLGFLVQPTSGVAGEEIMPYVRVAVRDLGGNVVNDVPVGSNAVSVDITSGTGTAGATLSGNSPMVGYYGVAIFPLKIDKPGLGYTLTATSPGLIPVTSMPFDIVAPPLDVSGTWVFAESLADVPNGFACSDTATMTINQTGGTFTGSSIQTGACTTPSGPVDNGGVFSLTNGVVADSTIAFDEPGSVPCHYTGTLTGSPPTGVTGAVSCVGGGLNFTGTWHADHTGPLTVSDGPRGLPRAVPRFFRIRIAADSAYLARNRLINGSSARQAR